MDKKSKDAKDQGVLYVRYNKRTPHGQVIEKLKQTSGGQLNNAVLNLIFLSGLVESLDWHGIDLETLNCACYEALKLFSEKVHQAQYKIDDLAFHIIRRKYGKSPHLIPENSQHTQLLETTESKMSK